MSTKSWFVHGICAVIVILPLVADAWRSGVVYRGPVNRVVVHPAPMVRGHYNYNGRYYNYRYNGGYYNYYNHGVYYRNYRNGRYYN